MDVQLLEHEKYCVLLSIELYITGKQPSKSQTCVIKLRTFIASGLVSLHLGFIAVILIYDQDLKVEKTISCPLFVIIQCPPISGNFRRSKLLNEPIESGA